MLHVVSGKGGTGKTTVAAALALALAHGGKRVMLMEVEGRQGLAQLFDTPPLPYEETKLTVAPVVARCGVWLLIQRRRSWNTSRCSTTCVEPDPCCDAWVRLTSLPPLPPVCAMFSLTGKAVELVRRKDRAAKVPTMRWWWMLHPPVASTRFLNVNTEIAGLAKVGPVRNQADSVMNVLRSPHTAVH